MVAQDLRYGVRLWWKTPGVTVAALVALALGIGATTAIFSVVDAVLLKPLPFREPRRLLIVWEKNPPQHKYRLPVAGANFEAWSRQSRTLESMAAILDTHINLTGGPNGRIDPEELKAERVSAGLFPLLGVQPILGRAFRAEEDRPGNTNFVMLGFELWQRRFGGDAGIAGKAIRLRDQSYTVTGVLPAGFQVLEPGVDVWLPLGLAPNSVDRNLRVVGRLAAGVGMERAQQEMEAVGDGLEQAYPALDRGWRPSLVTLTEEILGDVRRPLQILLAAVGLLLLVACANVANLLLARGAGRCREMAIRTALGAGRGRIVGQLLAESLVLAVSGGVLGLGLARGAVGLAVSLGSGGIPRLATARVDARLLWFALAVSVLTGVLFGLAPALNASNLNLNQALTESGRGNTMSRAGRWLRSGLVAVEIALALVVLIGAGLLTRSFIRLLATNPGFQAAHLLTFRVPLAGGRNATSRERATAFFQQLEDTVSALPGVHGVSAISALPLTGFGLGSTFAVDGRPLPPPGDRPLAMTRTITPGYFRVMGIPLVAGRGFTESDSMQSTPVIVVNQMLARRFWPGADALGGRIVMFDFNPPRVGQIVGVAGDVKSESMDKDDWPTIYMPYRQVPATTMVMAVRTAGEPMAVAAAVERAVHQLDPGQPVAGRRSMDDVLEQAMAGSRFNTTLLAVFGLLSFALAAVGIYGVVSYDVGQRTHEMGIRMALGAQPGDVLRLVLGGVARLAAAGIAAGLAAAFGATRLMASMLYGVEPWDFYTYAAISLILGAVALLAGYLPARRAMRLHPMTALRHE